MVLHDQMEWFIRSGHSCPYPQLEGREPPTAWSLPTQWAFRVILARTAVTHLSKPWRPLRCNSCTYVCLLFSQTLSLALLKYDRQLVYCSCNSLPLMNHYTMTYFALEIQQNNGLNMDVTYSSTYTNDVPFSWRTGAFIIFSIIDFYRGETLRILNHYNNYHHSRSWWSHEECT